MILPPATLRLLVHVPLTHVPLTHVPLTHVPLTTSLFSWLFFPLAYFVTVSLSRGFEMDIMKINVLTYQLSHEYASFIWKPAEQSDSRFP